VSLLPARESATGEVLSGVRSPCSADLHEVSQRAARRRKILLGVWGGGRLTGNRRGARFASPESYTPKHLAEKILTSKSALEGERKQVTQSRRHSPTRLASMSTPRMPGTLGSLNPSPTTKRLV